MGCQSNKMTKQEKIYQTFVKRDNLFKVCEMMQKFDETERIGK